MITNGTRPENKPFFFVILMMVNTVLKGENTVSVVTVAFTVCYLISININTDKSV